MPQLIKKQICGNDTLIVPPEKTPTDLCSFRILRPEQGKLIEFSEPGHEIALVVLSGQADIVVGTESFPGVGERDDIWSGRADSVYAGTGSMIKVTDLRPVRRWPLPVPSVRNHSQRSVSLPRRWSASMSAR